MRSWPVTSAAMAGSALRATLEARLAGGTGLDSTVETAIWDRAREREAATAQAQVDEATLQDEALGAALTICNYSLPSVLAAKECVNRAQETSLSEGLLFERRMFHAMFATEDQKEGMAAFVEKRPAAFKNR